MHQARPGAPGREEGRNVEARLARRDQGRPHRHLCSRKRAVRPHAEVRLAAPRPGPRHGRLVGLRDPRGSRPATPVRVPPRCAFR
eukprot:4567223-Heterocapsa_arctica.AAC.1